MLLSAACSRLNSYPLLISELKGNFSVDSILFDSEEGFALFTQVSNKRVALLFTSQELYAKALFQLDGICELLLLLSPIDHEHNYSHLCNETGINYIFSDIEISCDIPVIHFAFDKLFLPKQSIRTNTTWVIPTSGTTGAPKLISHTMSSLSRTIKNNKSLKPLYWGLLYSVSKFAGIQVLLQSVIGGGVLLIPSNTNAIDKTLAFFAKQGCNALSATPTMWRKILMSPVTSELKLKQITLGGEVVDDSILRALHSVFPEAKISHIYASTEAGVGFSVGDVRAGFPLSWLETGKDGVSIKIKDNVLWLRIPGRDYNLAKWGKIDIDDQGFINSEDTVQVTSDRVIVLGRSNGAINVGGNKVHPEEVEAVLLDYPGVRFASVRGQKNPFTGFIVVADVVIDLNNGAVKISAKDLIDFCKKRLQTYKVPAKIQFVESLAINSTGKLERKS